jgi:hypothetical protein
VRREVTLKPILGVGFAIALGASLWFLIRSRRPPAPVASQRPEIYLGLRDQILRSSRLQSVPVPASPTTPWGVLMDWGVPSGAASVVALSDGHASIYLSSGGGYLGGGESHESIRTAAKNAVSLAAEVRPEALRTDKFPLPARDEVIFYLLTDEGVFAARGTELEIRSHRHRLSKLGDAMQAVITEYRRIQP